MNFLDKSGLQYLWTKIKASFGTAIVESSQNSNIPFVANHQIVNVDRTGSINIYDWFQKASKGGTLDIFFGGAVVGSSTYCNDNSNNSYLYQMQVTQHGPDLVNIAFLKMTYDTYARLIKIDNTRLVVAEFVQNQEN